MQWTGNRFPLSNNSYSDGHDGGGFPKTTAFTGDAHHATLVLGRIPPRMSKAADVFVEVERRNRRR